MPQVPRGRTTAASQSSFDARGRLASATEDAKPDSATLRRILYDYSATDRMVGRRAEYAVLSAPGASAAAGDWKLEDRAAVLLSDGLPADTTFVWDALTDTLVAVYRAGASASTDANGGLVRQIIHGGLGYDDPIEVTVANGSGVLNRLYPTFDEAGAGSLQSVLNASGEVIARPLIDGAYAEEETVLGGVGIDRIAMAAKRDASGALESVELTIRATEPLDPKTVVAGSRLAAVAGNTVVRTTTAKPTLSDAATVRWTLTAAEWSALTDAKPEIVAGKPVAPMSISIAVTDSLRGVAWSSASPVMPAPAWAVAARPVFASPSLPVEYRESLTDAAALTSPSSSSASSSAETPLYEIQSLTSLAAPSTTARAAPAQRMLITSTFHALPFAEPATRLIYARARWFDPASGTFLSPDALGYQGASNLAAYCGGDPVNWRDPTGDVVVVMHGIWSTGSWAMEMSRGLRLGWLDQGAEMRQDVIKLVNQQEPGKAFGMANAFRAGVVGYLDTQTIAAGQRTAFLLQRLRTHLDKSRYHKNEPINVIAHSHGTAILLAAARSGGTRLRLGTVVLTGSDLHPRTALGALEDIADRVISYYSTEDDTTGNIHAAGGGHGFRDSRVIQRLVPAVDHTRGESEARRGVLSWMSDDLSKKYYAADTKMSSFRGSDALASEDWSWIREYIEIRQEMSLGFEQLPLP